MQALPSNQNQSLTSQSKPQNALALAENNEAQSKLDRLLIGCYTVQKLYGRDPGSLESVNDVFHTVLGRFPAEQVIKAFTIWIERSQEFPTPADIINLIKRKGRPPFSREIYIGISKKDGEDRTSEDWQYMRDYEADQKGGGSDFEDVPKDQAVLKENIRLRQELMQLKSEMSRVNQVLHETKLAKGIEPPKSSVQDRIARTVAFMKESGAPQSDIDDFLASSGMPIG